MGLKDVVEDNGGVVTDNPYRTYPRHEMESTLWEWFHEFEHRKFPEEVECDFIEVSHRITEYHAKAFHKYSPRSVFIRFSKDYIERSSTERVKLTLLHEMVHLYTFQKGYGGEINDSSPIFKWLCGAVGAPINPVPTVSNEWEVLMEPFIEMEG